MTRHNIKGLTEITIAKYNQSDLLKMTITIRMAYNKYTALNNDAQICLMQQPVAAERGGGMRPGGTVQGVAYREVKIWNSILFTVHTNAIAVTIRISIADLIGRGGNKDVCPGGLTPSRHHWQQHQSCSLSE